MDLFLSLELMRVMQMETENEICLAVTLFMITYCIVRISGVVHILGTSLLLLRFILSGS